MSLSTMPKQIEAHLPGSVREIPLVRTIAVGTLMAGVVLMLIGKRKAGVAVAAAGTLVGLAEDPEGIQQWAERMPGYVKAAQNVLGKVEGLVGQLAAQGDTIRRMLRR